MYPKRLHFSFQKLILWPLNWNPNLCFLVEGTNLAFWVVLAQFGDPIWAPVACAMGDPAAQNRFFSRGGQGFCLIHLSILKKSGLFVEARRQRGASLSNEINTFFLELKDVWCKMTTFSVPTRNYGLETL